jgi:hypothetical protein
MVFEDNTMKGEDLKEERGGNSVVEKNYLTKSFTICTFHQISTKHLFKKKYVGPYTRAI